MKVFGGWIKACLLALALPGAASAATQSPASAAAAAPTTVTGVADPLDYVRSTYRQYQSGNAPPDPGFAYSPELTALIAAALREQKDEPGRLDFDFWVSGQDWAIDKVDVTEDPAEDGRRIVSARFRNQSVPTHIRFHFVRLDGKWFVDDVENLDGPADNRWRLRKLLTEPPIVEAEAGWEIFYRGPEGSIGMYRPPPELRDGLLKVEVKVRNWDASEPNSEGLFLVEQDCKARNSRMIHGRVVDGNGKVEIRDEPEDWTPISPGTPAEALHAKLCPAG